MNARIEQLTRDYLDSLYLSRYDLDDNQKQNIIRLNSQSGWIIFNASSLDLRNSVGQDTIYEINSLQLRELLKEQIKVHHKEDWQRNFFTRGTDEYNNASVDEIEVKFFQWLRSREISTSRYSWVAIKKEPMGEDLGNLMMDIEQADITTGEGNRKIGNWQLDNLLNDPDIRNSRAPATSNNDGERQGQGRTETPPPPDNSSTGTSQPNPTPQSVNVSFTIDKVTRQWEDMGYFILEPTSAISLQGKQIIRICVSGNSNDFQEGNTISITNIKLENGRASIDNGTELWIGSYFDSMQVIARSNGPGSPSNPQSFPEVSQKNQELASEENNLALLVA